MCYAEMAELADAQASGACSSNTVRVQVPFSALAGAKRVPEYGESLIQGFFLHTDLEVRSTIQTSKWDFVQRNSYFCDFGKKWFELS